MWLNSFTLKMYIYILNKWFNVLNAVALIKAIKSNLLSIKTAEDLQKFALKNLGSYNKRKIPLNAIVEHITF
jgi:hypothetical protein